MDTVTRIFAGLTVLATLGGLFALAWHGDIPGSAAVAVGTAALSGAAGGFAVHAGAKLGLGSTQPSPALVSAVASLAEPLAPAIPAEPTS